MRQTITGLLATFFLSVVTTALLAQQPTTMSATYFTTSEYVREIPPLSQMDNIIASAGFEHVAPPKQRGTNTFVPGKGLPTDGDPLVSYQRNSFQVNAISEPIANFIGHQGTVLNDPTGAIGPNHYVYAFNSGFGIKDRSGNVLSPEASLGTLFPGETLGDPIVIYDNYADRFLIMEFSNSPNGFLIAVCQGPDPVNDGWFTYRFNTGSFPDYEKISIWSDGYYITANKNQNSASTSEVVYALERDEMLVGGAAQAIGFPLPGIVTSGFYSPGGFNSTGPVLPPLGTGHQITYLQDDSWSGVSFDHLKIWTTSVDWVTLANSTIQLTQELATTAFDGVFDGGSFQNIDEPGNGPDIDVLQATMMYMTNYRRFDTHNSVVLNFAVDISGNDTRSGIRWMELRQANDGDDWTVFQEGTYEDPNNHSAFSGSVIMDAQGNIGMGYTIASTTQFTSIRYTGRLDGDPLGVMTLGEGFAVDGDAQTNRSDGRYGDYAQITIDPTDDLTFWHIGEYMQGSSNTVRKSRVVAFQLGDIIPDSIPPTIPTDLAVTDFSATTISLSWTASTDDIGVTGYDVIDATGSVIVSLGNTTTTTVSGLAPLTTYVFAVQAKDAGGNVSRASDFVSATTLDAPSCEGGISSYPYSEGFENSLGRWSQSSDDDLDWIIDSNGTPSENTGPSSATEGSDYIYVEASGNGTGYPDKQAILQSPCFDLTSLTEPAFNFQYHMFGSNDMGSIDLEVSIDNGLSWTSLWNQTGNQGDVWQFVSIDLSAYTSSSILLRFNRVTGGTWQADIAIDDISLTNGTQRNCADSDLTLVITLDNYPQETSWSITNASGEVIVSAGYSTANPDGSTVTENINGLSSGDYTFTIDDRFGDGICCDYGNGSYTLSSSAGTIVSGGEFESSESTSFCVEGSSQARETQVALETHVLEEENRGDFKIYPVPVRDVINFEGAEKIKDIQVFSMYGQLVSEEVNFSKGFEKIDVSALSNGIYFIRITAEKQTITRKFVLDK